METTWATTTFNEIIITSERTKVLTLKFAAN